MPDIYEIGLDVARVDKELYYGLMTVFGGIAERRSVPAIYQIVFGLVMRRSFTIASWPFLAA